MSKKALTWETVVRVIPQLHDTCVDKKGSTGRSGSGKLRSGSRKPRSGSRNRVRDRETAFGIGKTAFRIGKNRVQDRENNVQDWEVKDSQVRKKVCSGLSCPESSTDGQESLSDKSQVF